MNGIDRRGLLAGLSALAIVPEAISAKPAGVAFPRDFLWGCATAGHQIEGNNTASDFWVLENIKPTIFAEPSGDADGSFELWPGDLDLVKGLGLNTYRFSLEWARIEPEKGAFSQAMLDHYKAIIAGCKARGLKAVVTFNHFTTPSWFAAAGGWAHADSPQLFARFCDRAARQLGSDIAYAVTLNEPNTPQLIREVFPEAMFATQAKMLEAAARAVGSDRFSTLMCFDKTDYEAIATNLIAAHKAGRAAIKAATPQLPVGVSLALPDDEAVGRSSIRDRVRQQRYGAWMDAARGDDFIGVQNYNRTLWDAKGMVAAPADSKSNYMGQEVYPPSLAAAVRYAHEATGIPVMVTEHGVGTDDDAMRAWLIPAALKELQATIAAGVPVLGYIHWSLLDNYEWLFGYKPHFGLFSVDRTTFARTPKPSAGVLGAIARANSV